MLHPLLGDIMPGTAFLIAAVLVEYYCGLVPAFCVMLAGLCIADYLFVPPYGRIDVIDTSDIHLLVSYPLITIVVIVLVERLRRAQYRAELLAAVAQSRYEMLLRHDNERLLASRATDEMHRMLHHIAQYNRSLILIKALDPSGAPQAASWRPRRRRHRTVSSTTRRLAQVSHTAQGTQRYIKTTLRGLAIA